MKTVIQALMSETHWPMTFDFVETTCIKRGMSESQEFSKEFSETNEYKGALADCLYSLSQAVNYSEAGKSVGNLTDKQRELLLKRANKLYHEIGEEEKDTDEPTVYFGG
jgi:hypothetical protein